MNLVKTYLALFCLAITIVAGCKKDNPPPPPTAPVVTTATLTNITSSGATAGGSIVSDGRDIITSIGIVWSETNATPTLADSVVEATGTNGAFTVEIAGLDFDKSFYIRAFATNSVGTGYGEVVTLSTANDTNKVRFTYNGEKVTYGIIVSPTSGKKWLDRNLGAKRVATAFDDYQAYGDLFQWGRPDDGHQLINWTSAITGTAISETTTELATSDVPGHSKFILAPYVVGTLLDWRDDNNRNRWATAPQGPCPAGWHVPTLSEWGAEVPSTVNNGTATSGGITDRNVAYNLLKLTANGSRNGLDNADGGKLNTVGDRGWYWSSSDAKQLDPYSIGGELELATNYAQIDYVTKATGLCVRCIKD